MRLLSAVSQGCAIPSRIRYATLAIGITATICSITSIAQSPGSDGKPAEIKLDTKTEVKPDAKTPYSHPRADTLETLYLANGTEQRDLNDIQTAMRNVLPNAHIYGVPSQQAIVLWATQDDLVLAHRILADLDKRRPSYRLTYTITELDGSKRLSMEHFALVAVAGDKSELKQGTRVPLITGSTDSETGKASSQVQYVDIGLSINATVDISGESLTLRSKLERTGLSDEKSSVGIQDPVIRQSTLDGTSTLVAGKPLVLGSLEVPGTSRRQEVEVIAEAIK